MNAESRHFQDLQKRFAAHIRHPQKNPPPKVAAQRMEVYCDLFYRNIENLLRGCFPILHSLHAAPDWQRLVRDFYHQHRCTTPYFHQIGGEFLHYLKGRKAPEKLPFLCDLAHFEWRKTFLDMAPDAPCEYQPLDDAEQLLSHCPVLVQPAEIASYQYPVHKIRLRRPPPPADTTTPPYFLVLYRDLKNRVHDVEINAVTARLLIMLQEDASRTGQQALELLAGELQRSDTAAVRKHGAHTLKELHTLGLIPGVQPAPFHASTQHH